MEATGGETGKTEKGTDYARDEDARARRAAALNAKRASPAGIGAPVYLAPVVRPVARLWNERCEELELDRVEPDRLVMARRAHVLEVGTRAEAAGGRCAVSLGGLLHRVAGEVEGGRGLVHRSSVACTCGRQESGPPQLCAGLCRIAAVGAHERRRALTALARRGGTF